MREAGINKAKFILLTCQRLPVYDGEVGCLEQIHRTLCCRRDLLWQALQNNARARHSGRQYSGTWVSHHGEPDNTLNDTTARIILETEELKTVRLLKVDDLGDVF